MKNINSVINLYFIAGTQDVAHLGGTPEENLLNKLEQALRHGISCFQFRDKGENSLQHQPARQQQLAERCRDLCRQYQVPFVINDNVDLALMIQADGIHVGQSDEEINQVIAKTEGKLFIGLSINNLMQAKQFQSNQAIDYFGIGPIFPTATKQDHQPPVGIDFITELRHQGITKPCVVIGGINESNAKLLRAKGADGIAVVSSLARASNLAETIKKLL
jgi:thiamine-phosphate diphosphorylase